MSEDIQRFLEGAIAPQENTVLFGHDEAEALLAGNYATGKLHHAILIEGPEGVGKATLAFRLAHHMLAHPDPKTAPDRLDAPDTSSQEFRTIAAGASHNLIHLVKPLDDKGQKIKTAITVDEVRKVGKFLSQTTGNNNWRIVIIDVADDLNRNAANALLKMLEEPPRRTLFLVLSHHPGRLLPTIRSRCMPLILRPLSDDDMIRAIEHLGLPIPPGKRDMVLRGASGSVSTAIKLVNYGGLDIVEAFEAMLAQSGPGQRREMHRLADALSGKSSDETYAFFADHVGQHVARQARVSALAGDSARADKLSRLHASLFERMAISDGYNLDRKQTVLTILGDIAQAG